MSGLCRGFLSRLLRTAFLADYFVNAKFRHELRRALNRSEAVNALKRAIYTGRIAPAQAKRADEMQAAADALNLLANLVMAWNAMQMRQVLQGWANRRQHIAPELMGKIAPTRIEGSICVAPSGFRPSAMPMKSCRRWLSRSGRAARETGHASTPKSLHKSTNRKANSIKHLDDHPHASA